MRADTYLTSFKKKEGASNNIQTIKGTILKAMLTIPISFNWYLVKQYTVQHTRPEIHTPHCIL